MIYKLDDMEIEEENRVWRSHFSEDLYSSHPKEVMAYLFDDFADRPIQMRGAGAVISMAIKQDAVHRWKENRLSKLSSCITGEPTCKARKLEYKILERIQYCLIEGIPYSSDSIANALQSEYIQKFT